MCPEPRVPCGSQESCSQVCNGSDERDRGTAAAWKGPLRGCKEEAESEAVCKSASSSLAPSFLLSLSLPTLSHKLPEAQQISQ